MTQIKYIAKRYKDIIHIYDPVFRHNFYYYHNCKTEAEFIRKLLKWDKKSFAGIKDTGGAGRWVGDRKFSWIWARGNDHRVIVHEVFHASVNLFRNKETPLTKKTEEVYAYYLEFITGSIFKLLSRKSSYHT